MKSIRPMYVFTVLAVLLGGTLWTITHTAEIKEAVSALLNIIAGGLLTLMGTVVNNEFNAAKTQERSRATDAAPAAATLSVTGAAGETATATATQGAKT